MTLSVCRETVQLVMVLTCSVVLSLMFPLLLMAEQLPPEGDCILSEKKAATAAQQSNTINKVFVCTEDIFDEKNEDENSFIYRTANFLHIKTKHKYIEEQLLFQPGDNVDERVIAESERNIRANDYISEVSITRLNSENPSTQQDIVVRTRDAWTTKPTLSFSRSGGVNTSSIGLREDNLFGEGIRLSVKRKIDIDRNTSEFKFQDDTAFGTRRSLYLEYANNSDGNVKAIHWHKPYRSLDDTSTFGVFYRYEKLVNDFYVLGEESLSFSQLNKDSDIYFGFSAGFIDGKTIRHQFGIQSIKSSIESIDTSTANPSPLSVLNAVETNNHAPYYQFHLIEDRFEKTWNRYAIGKDEDINYGLELRARFGIASSAFDSDDEQLIHELELSKIFPILDDADLSLKAKADVLIDKDEGDHIRSHMAIDYFKSQSRNFKFFSSLSTEIGHSLRNGEQVYLDNLRGLRGYPVYHLSGTESVLFTMEERVYFDKVLWNIINIGAAMFVDIGNIQGEQQTDQLDQDYFRSAGIGLRLGSNRSSSTSIMHIDFAKPLDAHSGSRDFQIAIEMKDRF